MPSIAALYRYPIKGMTPEPLRRVALEAGGTMPFLIERFDLFEKMPQNRVTAPDGFRAAARKFYYDTAQASNPIAMASLTRLVDVSQIVFGTDYPYRTGIEHVTGLAPIFGGAAL